MGTRHSGESGQTLIIGAFFMVGVFGLFALVLDVGGAWAQRRSLQNTADAAALAGAQLLDGTAASETAARAVAVDYATTNVPSLDAPPEVTFSEGSTNISVQVKKTAKSFFIGTLGIGDNVIAARAKARVRRVNASAGIVPIAVPNANIRADGVPITIETGVPNNLNAGPVVGTIQLGALDPRTPKCQNPSNGGGTNAVGDGIECGSSGGIVLGQDLASKNGTQASVTQAFEARFANAAANHCSSLEDVFIDPNASPRVIEPRCSYATYRTTLVLIPIIDQWHYPRGNGNAYGTVIALGLFWLDPTQNFIMPNNNSNLRAHSHRAPRQRNWEQALHQRGLDQRLHRTLDAKRSGSGR